jgi:hypothetical protein
MHIFLDIADGAKRMEALVEVGFGSTKGAIKNTYE